MKIKALIITAALVVASVASSMAQVYSANAVGYVNMSLPVGYSVIANPLNNGDNSITTVLPGFPDLDGATIYRYDPTVPGYKETVVYIDGFGWTPEVTLPPGEGFFIQLTKAVNVTFVGDVPQGNLSYPLTGGLNLNLVGSMVPQEAGLGHLADSTGPAVGLEFPAQEGDTVSIYMNGVGWGDTLTYLPGEGLGWLGAPDSNLGPTIGVGQGFWVQKAGAMQQSWTRQFSVN